jgi:hypothetical protein
MILNKGESPMTARDDLAAIEAAGLSAALPDFYQWGDDAMSAFEFGKQRATEAILAALRQAAEKAGGGGQ